MSYLFLKLYYPAISLLSIYPKEFTVGSQRGICTPMFIAALFTTSKRWKQPKCPLVDEWIKRTWYIPTGGYYSTLKKKEILSYVTTWMNFEEIMLLLYFFFLTMYTGKLLWLISVLGFFFWVFFWPRHVACGDLSSPTWATAVKVPSPNHWTARKLALPLYF